MENKFKMLLATIALSGAMNLSAQVNTTNDQNRTDQNRTDQNRTDQSTMDRNKMDQNTVDQNRTGQNTKGQPATGQNRMSQTQTDQSGTQQGKVTQGKTTKKKTVKNRSSQRSTVKNRASNAPNMMSLNKLRMTDVDVNMLIPDISAWPASTQMAVEEITAKYGKPDAVGPDMLGWKDKGQFKMIHIDKNETRHNFPVEHTDFLKQTISYQVPADKVDDLAQFDGSIIVDRTQGLMSARCDKEANNLLALNLANDIVTGQRTVEEARKAFGDMLKDKMNGGNPEYMQRLTFSPRSGTGDPDVNTTGLTKADMMKGNQNMKKTDKMDKNDVNPTPQGK